MKNLFFKFRRQISFSIAGIINTLVDFAVFSLLSLLFSLSAPLCQIFGYCSGIVCSFILNRSLTFKDGNVPLRYQILRFAAVNLFSLALSTGLTTLLAHFSVNRYIAKAFVTLITMFINYFAYKIIVFGVSDKF